MSVDNNILVGDSVYIVGHTNPDLDAVAAAHAYQIYRHSQGDFNYVAVRCDEVNPVTAWAYKYWGLELPPLIENVAGKSIVLVDHTDPEQRPHGWQDAEIIEVIDHHKLKLETSMPPKITIRPYGSTATLIAQKMMRRGIKMDKAVAGILLSAIIDDTLALRSPITTNVDKQMAGHLAVESGIVNLSDFAREQFAEKDVWLKMTPKDVIQKDMKQYDMNGRRVAIAQVESMDNQKLIKKAVDYKKQMDKSRLENGIDIYLVMLTDLIRNDCIVVVSAEGDFMSNLEKIYSTHRIDDSKIQLPGVISRKKQVEGPLLEFFG